MDLPTFRTLFPEFEKLKDPALSAWLDISVHQVDVKVFGPTFDMAHGLKTAHNIALSPFGKNSRMTSDKGETTYGKQFQELLEAATCGLRVPCQ